MQEVFMSYNPFRLEFDFELNGNPLDKSSKVYGNRGKRLQLWVNGLTQMLYDDVVNDDFKLEFKGTTLDYLDLKEDVDNFNNSNNGGHVELYHNEAKSSEDRLKDLRELFNYMQETSPFDDLREERVRVNFEKAMGSEFEVAVIATMSSGKSTLLNALLGRELMPSKNEACTATIARIKDVDGAYGFNAKCLDENENIVVEEVKNVSADTMSSFNENESVSYIDVEGDIPFVESHSIQLVLLDTPGPNNSRDPRHKEKTFSVIKDSNPMILYILNATQLSTNDDNALLDAVGDAMNQGGKQSRDRFMFVVNKVDCFDPDKGESVERALINVKDYLRSHGIENPNIYLASSETAKVIRLHKNRYELSRKQRQTYSGLDLFIDEEELHLEKYAPLSRLGKDKVSDALLEAKSEEDIALIHTGIPVIEIAINEYLEKYAITTKVEQAVSTFIKQINSKNIEGNLINELKNDAEKAKSFHEKIEKISVQISDGKKGAEFKDRIKNLNLAKDAHDLTQKLIREVQAEINKLTPDEEYGSMKEARRYVRNFNTKIEDLQPRIKVELESIIDTTIKESADQIMKEYRQHIDSIVSELNMEKFDTAGSSINIGDMFANGLRSANDMLSDFVETKRVKVGTRTVKDSTWWKPWTWGRTREENVYENRELVNMDEFYQEAVDVINKDFDRSVKSAIDEAKQVSEDFKKYFLNEIDKLENLLSKKINELRDMTANVETIEKHIKENERNQAWLKDFVDRLNNILEI